jgi:hypothetical protein
METAFWNSLEDQPENHSRNSERNFESPSQIDRDDFTRVLEKFASQVAEQLPEKRNSPCFIAYPCIEETLDGEGGEGTEGSAGAVNNVTEWVRQLIEDLRSAGLDVQCDLDYLQSNLDRATYLQELILRNSGNAAIIGTEKFHSRIEKFLDPKTPRNNNSLERLERKSFGHVKKILEKGGNAVVVQLNGECGNALASLANVSSRNIINFDGSFPFRSQISALLRTIYKIDQRSSLYQKLKTEISNLPTTDKKILPDFNRDSNLTPIRFSR